MEDSADPFIGLYGRRIAFTATFLTPQVACMLFYFSLADPNIEHGLHRIDLGSEVDGNIPQGGESPFFEILFNLNKIHVFPDSVYLMNP